MNRQLLYFVCIVFIFYLPFRSDAVVLQDGATVYESDLIEVQPGNELAIGDYVNFWRADGSYITKLRLYQYDGASNSFYLVVPTDAASIGSSKFNPYSVTVLSGVNPDLFAGSGSGSGTVSDSTCSDNFARYFISDFNQTVFESLMYALLMGLGLGWAGSFFYRRFRA